VCRDVKDDIVFKGEEELVLIAPFHASG